MQPAKSDQRLHSPISWLELDRFYSGLELDRNVSSLEPVSVHYGPGSTPAECFELNVGVQYGQKIKTTSIRSGLKMQPAKSDQHLHSPTSGLELDRNVSGLEPVSVGYGTESTPAECFEQNVPQLLIGIEDVEVVESEIQAGPTIQEPNEDLPRKKSWHRLTIALILFMVLIAIVVSVSVTQTWNSSR